MRLYINRKSKLEIYILKKNFYSFSYSLLTRNLYQSKSKDQIKLINSIKDIILKWILIIKINYIS